MNPFHALRLGWKKARSRKRAILLYWAFHTALALVVAIPLAGTGISLVAKTKYGDELLRDFDVMFLMEAVNSAGRTEWAPMAALPVLLLLLVGAIYLSGGAMHVLGRSAEVYSPALFWEGAGLYFWRFLRVSIYSLLAWIPFLVVRTGISRAAGKIWGEGLEEAPVYYASQIGMVLGVLLAGYAVTVVDFSRARIASEGSRRILSTVVSTSLFVAKRPLLTMGPWALLAVVFGLATALYLSVANRLPATLLPLAILVIILQQAYILLRICLRFTGWGAVIEIDAAARGENHEPEQEIHSYVGGGGDGRLRAGAQADPEAESPSAG